MEIYALLKTYWFDLLQSAAIVSGFIYTALSFSLDSRARQAETLLAVGAAHRKIWSALVEDPDLARILETEPDTNSTPVTKDEEHFVLLVFLHLATVYQATELGLHPRWPGLDDDIRRFFSLPIPKQLLERYLPLQPPVFQNYLRGILDS